MTDSMCVAACSRCVCLCMCVSVRFHVCVSVCVKPERRALQHGTYIMKSVVQLLYTVLTDSHRLPACVLDGPGCVNATAEYSTQPGVASPQIDENNSKMLSGKYFDVLRCFMV